MASTWPKAASTLLLSPIYVRYEFNNNNVTSPEPKFDQAQNQLQTAIFMVPKFIRPFFWFKIHIFGVFQVFVSVCQNMPLRPLSVNQKSNLYSDLSEMKPELLNVWGLRAYVTGVSHVIGIL